MAPIIFLITRGAKKKPICVINPNGKIDRCGPFVLGENIFSAVMSRRVIETAGASCFSIMIKNLSYTYNDSKVI